MNFQDLLTKMKQLDEIAPVALGSMAAQAMANKVKAGTTSRPASPDNPWNEAEPTKEGVDGVDSEVLPPASVTSPDDEMLATECGGMMSSMSAPKQSDSVTMNVSMNGSGAGGIKDLLDILRNIENSGGQDADDVLFGVEAEEAFSDATTRPNPTMVPTPDSGDDLHREKEEYPKANGGGNPMRMHEALVAKLSEKYAEIKGE